MATPKWIPLTVEETVTALGVKIVLTTDVPCHLWCRITTTPPLTHFHPITVRGVTKMADPYFCFDNYHDNEQEEPGDTLVHTFIKEPWPVCETRYFYFHGTIAAVASPSTSPIFKYHRTFAPPTPSSDCQTILVSPVGFCQYWNANAQTITPDHTYEARQLHIPLVQHDPNTKGPYIIKLAPLAIPCWDLELKWSYEGYSTDLPLPGLKEWQIYDLPNIPMLKDFPYILVVHTLPGWYWWNGALWIPYESAAAIKWWTSGATNPYPRGKSAWGCNFKTKASSWVYSNTQDRGFCLYE
jgi:hypothetical protein